MKLNYSSPFYDTDPNIPVLRHLMTLRTRSYTDGVDVRLVASEGLSAHSFSDVPQLGGGVARAGHKQPGVGRQGQAHDVAGVPGERGGLLAGLDVPEGAAAETRDTQGWVRVGFISVLCSTFSTYFFYLFSSFYPTFSPDFF